MYINTTVPAQIILVVVALFLTEGHLLGVAAVLGITFVCFVLPKIHPPLKNKAHLFQNVGAILIFLYILSVIVWFTLVFGGWDMLTDLFKGEFYQ